MMNLDGNAAASAEQNHQHSPLCRPLPPARETGKGSVYPRASRGTNSSLFQQHLPAWDSWPGPPHCLAWSDLILQVLDPWRKMPGALMA